MPRYTEIDIGFCHLSACATSVVYSIPPAGVHRRTGEPEPLFLAILYKRGRIRFLGSAPRDCSRSSSRLIFLDNIRVLERLVFDVASFEKLLRPVPLELLHLHRN